MSFTASGATCHGHAAADRAPDHGHEGALAAFGRSVRAAFAFASPVDNHLVPALDPVLELNAAGEIAEVGVLLSVANISTHALEYDLVAMRLTVEGHEGRVTAPLALNGELAPERAASVAECLAAVGPLPAGRMVEGVLEITLGYGARGAARHELAACYALAFKAGDHEIAAFSHHPI